MGLSPTASFFVLLTSLLCLLPPARLTAQPEEPPYSGRNSLALRNPAQGLSPSLIATYHNLEGADTDVEKFSDDDPKGGIREIVPNKYLARYRRKSFCPPKQAVSNGPCLSTIRISL